MILILFIFVFGQLVFNDSWTEAGTFGFGAHSGYGIIKFKEKETYLGDNFESESRQNVILLGGSGEYSFQSRLKNFYIGITTDWAFGFGDNETWRQNNAQVQTNDIKIFGQFYDLRFGYKNFYPVRKKVSPESSNGVYYRIYASGGWDGLHFKRDNVIWQGTPIPSTTEDISLWRIGLGTGLTLNLFHGRLDKWALDGRAAYSYYPEGETKDSSLPQYTFDTNGTCLDIGFGVVREMAKNMRFYLGVSYTLQKLKGSTTSQAISWKSKMEILTGVINLTYAF